MLRYRVVFANNKVQLRCLMGAPKRVKVVSKRVFVPMELCLSVTCLPIYPFDLVIETVQGGMDNPLYSFGVGGETRSPDQRRARVQTIHFRYKGEGRRPRQSEHPYLFRWLGGLPEVHELPYSNWCHSGQECTTCKVPSSAYAGNGQQIQGQMVRGKLWFNSLSPSATFLWKQPLRQDQNARKNQKIKIPKVWTTSLR